MGDPASPATGGSSLAATARVTTASLVALTALEVLWEIMLAPTPGLHWLVVKALPLAVLIPGVARGARRARQWLALLTPWYCAEALVRTLTEPGRHALVAAMAATLAFVTFMAVLLWFRAERRNAKLGTTVAGHSGSKAERQP